MEGIDMNISSSAHNLKKYIKAHIKQNKKEPK